MNLVTGKVFLCFINYLGNHKVTKFLNTLVIFKLQTSCIRSSHKLFENLRFSSSVEDFFTTLKNTSDYDINRHRRS